MKESKSMWVSLRSQESRMLSSIACATVPTCHHGINLIENGDDFGFYSVLYSASQQGIDTWIQRKEVDEGKPASPSALMPSAHAPQVNAWKMSSLFPSSRPILHFRPFTVDPNVRRCHCLLQTPQTCNSTWKISLIGPYTLCEGTQHRWSWVCYITTVSNSSTLGFLHCSTTDIWGQILLFGGGLSCAL